jgi:hypothetical protein
VGGRLGTVSHPVVLSDVLRAINFARGHAGIAPRAVALLGRFLAHCSSVAVPGLEAVVGSACESLCLLAVVFPALVLQSHGLLPIADALYDRLRVANALALMGFFVHARMDDLPVWLNLFRAVAESGAPEDIDSLLVPFTTLLPRVQDAARFGEMVLLLHAISAQPTSLSVLASLIAACDIIVARVPGQAARLRDAIFMIVYRVAASFARLELEDVGIEPCRIGLRVLLWAGGQVNVADARIRGCVTHCATMFVQLVMGNEEAERRTRKRLKRVVAMLMEKCPGEIEQLMNSPTALAEQFQRIAQMPDEEPRREETF